MILTIAAILLILWLLGFSFHVAGGFVHILIILAVVAVIWHFVARRRV